MSSPATDSRAAERSSATDSHVAQRSSATNSRALALLLAAACALCAARCGETLSVDYDVVTSACVRASACGVKAFAHVAVCIDDFHKQRRFGSGPIVEAIYRCVAQSSGRCPDVERCFQRGGTCDKRFVGRCVGDTRYYCDYIDKRVYAEDCSAAGMVCRPSPTQQFTTICTRGDCAAGFTSHCEGDHGLICTRGVLEVFDCAVDGKTCAGGGSMISCVAPTAAQAPPCADDIKPRCEGWIAVRCVDGHLQRERCQGRCDGGRCVSGDQCVTSDTPNRCAGDALEACIDGRWQRFDCATLGLGRCIPGDVGGANCSPPPST